VYGVDSVLYHTIQAHISVNPDAIQKININFDDAQGMGKHPYLKFDKAKAILTYRKQAGNFESIEDIRNAVFLTDEQYNKLEPYLSLN
jgi:DNA uptake protein ComE-like DNA-binding protein